MNSEKSNRGTLRTLLGLIGVVAVAALAAPAGAAAAPEIGLEAEQIEQRGLGPAPAQDEVPHGSYSIYEITVRNTSASDPTSGGITVDFSVPAGIRITKVTDEIKEHPFLQTPMWDCSIAGDSRSASCFGPDGFGFLGGPLPITPGTEACEDQLFGFAFSCRIFVTLKVEPEAALGTVTPEITACGGGQTTCPAVAATAVNPLEVVPTGFYLTNFDGKVLDENGDPATQAGSRPFTAKTDFDVETHLTADGFEIPIENIRDIKVKLPPGLVGNPTAYPTCTQIQVYNGNCPPGSQLGYIEIDFMAGFLAGERASVFNMERSGGHPANFAFNIASYVIQIYPELRTGTDYGLTVNTKNSAETIPFQGVDFTFWGVPGDPVHTPERACFGGGENITYGCPGSDPKPFLSLPTSCVGPVETFLEVISWNESSDETSFLSHDNTEPVPNPIGAEGCNAVPFSPSVEARPTTNVADSPSGLEVDIEVPQQNETCDPGPPINCGVASAHLRDTTITLPEGFVINPAGANGLDGCSLAEFGLTSPIGAEPIQTTPAPGTCPDASKVGTVEIETALVDHPLRGSVHIADPFDNPFNSLVALYVTVNDPATGTVVKLAGRVDLDPATGRITTTFEESPQLPFDHFRLHFFGGAGGTLRTPAVCGNYTTSSSLTPWTFPDSGPPPTPQDTWALSQGPAGSACPNSPAERPHAPDLDAGTVSPIASSYSPMVINLRREDGSQEFANLTLTPPPGLVGKLAGIPYCPDSDLAAAAGKSGREEQASPSCPAASHIGHADVAAGSGPAPYWAHGQVYLTSPYKGAPFGLAVVTPATAGPFDLGTVVVRTAVRVNPVTAQITADADPIPAMLKGIPLDVRQVLIKLDRAQFTRNGTNCDPLAFTGGLVSTMGVLAPLAERFQLGECSGLAFKPKMTLSLLGPTKRTGNPRLVANLTAQDGEANISQARVTLPSIAFLDNSHIGTVCTRVQFAANQCPEASVYGRAKAITPLLGHPLEGAVYLRSSDNTLPDLVADLRGPATQPIRLELSGITDTVKGALRNTFLTVPDAPVSSFELELFGGKRGLIDLSRKLCAKRYRANIELDAQNGKSYDTKPVVKSSCKGKKKKKKKRSRQAKRHGRAVR